jgi:GNAT superfamily N-acetyltransferase
LSDLIIRDAKESEYAAMLNVTLAAYQEYASMMPPFAWEEYSGDMADAIQGPLPADHIVAEQDGAIVGSVLLYPAGTVFEAPDGRTFTLPLPEVRLLAVSPEARGRGVGRALTEECIRRARQDGAAALNLHTTDMMQTAMQLYERMGFVRAPDIDFSPAPEIVIKGYRYDLGEPDSSTA